jgi:hypothetical protein
VAATTEQLEDRSDALFHGFLGKRREIQSRQLAGKAIALVVTPVFVAERAFAPGSRPPVHTLRRPTVPAPVHSLLEKVLVEALATVSQINFRSAVRNVFG